MFDKFVRRMGMKTDHGWDDPTVVGFIVIWGIFGYGIYLTIDAVINRFF
tara:strand:+ start:597 stop:743 length:147 start_codon:yes stop_codon:yes gene_type:complete